MREHSIRTSRRRKFVECITREDVDIGMCRLFDTTRSYLFTSGSPTTKTGLERRPRRAAPACLAVAIRLSPSPKTDPIVYAREEAA